MLPESVFFVLHRPSGTGHSAAEAGRLQAEFHCRFGGIACRVFALAASHDHVVRMTRDFLAWAPAPSLLIAGGGGGTFRAMVQGVMECADSGLTRTEHTWVSALRLGSGNVVPKHLGIASDPLEALRGIAGGLAAGQMTRCCVYCCTFVRAGLPAERHYGVTLGCLGQFALIPGDVERWKHEHRGLMKRMSKWIPLEAITLGQYLAASAVRGAQCLARPDRLDRVEVIHAGSRDRFRLLAGALLNFDLACLPIRARCGISEPRLTLALLPYKNRASLVARLVSRNALAVNACHYVVTPEAPVELVFADPDAARRLALDEDTFMPPDRIRFEVAGLLRFVGSLSSEGDCHESLS